MEMLSLAIWTPIVFGVFSSLNIVYFCFALRYVKILQTLYLEEQGIASPL